MARTTLIGGGQGTDDRWRGQILDDRYLVAKPLGAGASATVYRGESLSTRRQVAIKIVATRGVRGNSATIVARLQREIAAVSRLHNPHIVSIYDVLEVDGGFVAVVMELVTGITLQQLVERQGPLSPVRACRIARQIANGLAEAHEAKMIHRDLKPENLMLGRLPDGGDFLHILDFGIVHLHGDATAAITQGFIGTPLYASPEQFQNQAIDLRSDIYSLGAVLYFLVAGRPPFQSDSTYDLYMQHINEEPPRLQATSNGQPLPERLDELVDQMLAKTPEERPESLWQVIEALDHVIIGACHRRPSPQSTPDSTEGVDSDAPTASTPRLPCRGELHQTQVSLSSTGAFVVLADGDDQLLHFASADASARRLYPATTSPIASLALCKNSLLIGHDNGVVSLSTLDSEQPQVVFRAPHRKAITAVDIADNSRWMAFATVQGRVFVRRPGYTDDILWGDYRDGPPPTSMALNPTQGSLAVARSSGNIDIFKVTDSFRFICSLTLATPARAIALSPDGYLLTVVSIDGTATIFEILTKKPVARLALDEVKMLTVADSESGSPVVLAAVNKRLRQFPLENLPHFAPSPKSNP